MAAEQVVHRRRRAAIGNVHDVDLGLDLEQFGRQVGDRAGAGRREADLAGIGAGVGDELLQRVHADRRVNGQHLGDAHHQREQGEVLLPVERHLAGHERHDGERGRPVDADRVAVGRALGDRVDPGHAAGAGAVLDHDLLAELGAHAVAQVTPEQIGGTAGRERHDELDRPVGECLRPGRG